MNMRKITVVTLTAALLGAMMIVPQSAAAGSKHYFYNWHGSHWKYLDFKPYVERYEHSHRPMQQGSVYNFGKDVDAAAAVQGFRNARMLHKFYIDEDTGLSVTEVGPYFYDLSHTEKRHFLATLDRVYNVTRSDQRVMFLKDWNTKKDVGQYGVNGLMLF